MKKIFLGTDPGKEGALAALDEKRTVLGLRPMPLVPGAGTKGRPDYDRDALRRTYELISHVSTTGLALAGLVILLAQDRARAETTPDERRLGSLVLRVEPAVLEVFDAPVIRVHDGDTLTVLRDDRTQVRIRVEGIDCPELGQPFGRRAKRFTSEKASGQVVRILPKERDRHGRLVARVLVAGEDLSQALIRAGLAWHFKRYSDDQRLADEERVAQDAKLGLWSQPNPIAPWDYRRARRRR